MTHVDNVTNNISNVANDNRFKDYNLNVVSNGDNYKDISLGDKDYIYRIYRDGKIINLSRQCEVGTHTNAAGYKVLSLSKNMYLIHRIVAMLFIPNPNNYDYINHKDENKTNNNVENLEWCTNKYNSEYSVAKKVYQYDFEGNLIRTYISTQNTYYYGFIGNLVAACCRGIKKSHAHYIWSYTKLTKEEVFKKVNNKRAKFCKVAKIDVNTNETIYIYGSVQDLANALNIGYSNTCRHIRKGTNINGYYYKYIK